MKRGIIFSAYDVDGESISSLRLPYLNNLQRHYLHCLQVTIAVHCSRFHCIKPSPQCTNREEAEISRLKW